MLYVEVSKQELDEFLAFRDALRLVETKEEAETILIPKNQLIAYFLNLSISQTVRYGDTYYQFNRQSLMKLADWVLKYKNEL